MFLHSYIESQKVMILGMFKEGGKGVSVRYISPSDNRGAGAAIMHALKGKLKDTRVLFRIIG